MLRSTLAMIVLLAACAVEMSAAELGGKPDSFAVTITGIAGTGFVMLKAGDCSPIYINTQSIQILTGSSSGTRVFFAGAQNGEEGSRSKPFEISVPLEKLLAEIALSRRDK